MTYGYHTTIQVQVCREKNKKVAAGTRIIGALLIKAYLRSQRFGSFVVCTGRSTTTRHDDASPSPSSAATDAVRRDPCGVRGGKPIARGLGLVGRIGGRFCDVQQGHSSFVVVVVVVVIEARAQRGFRQLQQRNHVHGGVRHHERGTPRGGYETRAGRLPRRQGGRVRRIRRRVDVDNAVGSATSTRARRRKRLRLRRAARARSHAGSRHVPSSHRRDSLRYHPPRASRRPRRRQRRSSQSSRRRWRRRRRRRNVYRVHYGETHGRRMAHRDHEDSTRTTTLR